MNRDHGNNNKVYRVKMEKIVAKVLFGSDADYMYEYNSCPGTCPVCGNRLSDIPNPLFRLRKKKGDVFGTYDLYQIVSSKFKMFCEEQGYPNLSFLELESSKGFYIFNPNEIYRLDYHRRKVQFLNKRECCGSYDEIIGAVPSYKEKGWIFQENDFIRRSEYLFGSYREKTPLIIVGLETAAKMKQYGISGIYFRNVLE